MSLADTNRLFSLFSDASFRGSLREVFDKAPFLFGEPVEVGNLLQAADWASKAAVFGPPPSRAIVAAAPNVPPAPAARGEICDPCLDGHPSKCLGESCPTDTVIASLVAEFNPAALEAAAKSEEPEPVLLSCGCYSFTGICERIHHGMAGPEPEPLSFPHLEEKGGTEREIRQELEALLPLDPASTVPIRLPGGWTVRECQNCPASYYFPSGTGLKPTRCWSCLLPGDEKHRLAQVVLALGGWVGRASPAAVPVSGRSRA